MDSSPSDGPNMQIFKNIAEIITDTEFNQASAQFFGTHCAKFDENVEENKHEYKQLYEEYLSITEKVIEARLKQEFSVDEEAIQAFYLSFEDSKAAYQAENADAVEALFGMIDFDEFKKKMLEAKKGMADEGGMNAQEELDYTKMLVEDQWANYQRLVGESLTDKVIGWKKKVEQKQFKNGYKCTVYQRKQEGKSVDILRIDVEFQNVTVADCVNYWESPPSSKILPEVKLLEKISDNNKIIYMRFVLPMMSDRDNVSQFVTQEKEGGTFMTIKTVEHDSKPPQKDVIRMFYYECAHLKQVGENVQMTTFEYMDFKGYLPASLMNMTIASEVANEFSTMVKHIHDNQKQG